MIGDILRQFRETNHLTPKDLAQRLNVSVQSISKWENDACEPSIENLTLLSNLYDVSIDVLVGNTKQKKEFTLSRLIRIVFVFLLVTVLGVTITVGSIHGRVMLYAHTYTAQYKKNVAVESMLDTFDTLILDKELDGFVYYTDGYYVLFDKNLNMHKIGNLKSKKSTKYRINYTYVQNGKNICYYKDIEVDTIMNSSYLVATELPLYSALYSSTTMIGGYAYE